MTGRIDHAARLESELRDGWSGDAVACPADVALAAADYIRTLEGLVRYIIKTREVKCGHVHPGPDAICAYCQARALGLVEE